MRILYVTLVSVYEKASISLLKLLLGVMTFQSSLLSEIESLQGE